MVDTALREAREELGVNVVTGRVWGVLKPLRDMVSTKLNCHVDETVSCKLWNIYCFYMYATH